MKSSLISPEDTIRIRAKYPDRVKSKNSERKTLLSVQAPSINHVPEFGPLEEHLSEGSVKLCKICTIREANSGTGARCKFCRALITREDRKENPKRWILIRLKNNAKKRGIVFDLKESEIPDFPDFCPVFPWIKLEYKVGSGRTNGSVSVDRINNDKGYVPRNIRIISDYANYRKGDATDKELIALGKDAEKRMAVLRPKDTNGRTNS